MKNSWFAVSALIACCGCSTPRNPAPGIAAAGSGNPPAAFGPYSVQYASEGTNDMLRITRGTELLYSKSGNNITVYADNQPLFDYAYTPAGTLTAAFMVHIRAANGRLAFSLLDENADGVFDQKIDYGTKTVYRWKDNQWVK